MATRRQQQRHQRQALSVAGAAATALLVAACSILDPVFAKDDAENNDKNNKHNNHRKNPIEVNLMEKIANKSYLNPALLSAGAARHQRYHTASSSSSSSHSVTMMMDQHQNNTNNHHQYHPGRPLGVPSKLRILAIDLPEMQTEAFANGSCRVAFDRVYPNDGVAPPALLEIAKAAAAAAAEDSNNSNPTDVKSKRSGRRKQNHATTIAVEQKAFVQSLLRCFHDSDSNNNNSNNNNTNNNRRMAGVEVMEASFEQLNPRNLRKTRQLGGYHYDPGKYSTTTTTTTGNNHSTSKEGSNKESNTDASSDDDKQTSNNIKTNKETTSIPPQKEEEEYQVLEDDELEAPWNQYAWMEELKFRIHGYVPFGDSLEPSSRWNRYFTGNTYKQTVPSQRSPVEMFLPPFLQTDPEGVEGGYSNNRHNINWASNKPHAVIANGASIQRVPSALRLLQKTCRDANVPLFVLHDPRGWGGNTHSSLHQALLDLRYLVKQNVILQAMEQQSGFSRGRFVGRLERQLQHVSETAWSDRQRRQEAIRKRRWDKLDAASLEKRLIEHGVLRKADSPEGGTALLRYTPAMVQVARQCVADEEERAQTKLDGDAAIIGPVVSSTASKEVQDDGDKDATSASNVASE